MQCNKRNRSTLEPCRRHIICPSLKEILDINEGPDLGPKGFWRSGDKGYLCSGSWEALVIIFRDLGETS